MMKENRFPGRIITGNEPWVQFMDIEKRSNGCIRTFLSYKRDLNEAFPKEICVL